MAHLMCNNIRPKGKHTGKGVITSNNADYFNWNVIKLGKSADDLRKLYSFIFKNHRSIKFKIKFLLQQWNSFLFCLDFEGKLQYYSVIIVYVW